ncbi:MAG: FHA domain-containing protein, partial [Oscillospiraceae bacterium]|nr:FHA domain-containing protein [Oscillospiraceae bacterium]
PGPAGRADAAASAGADGLPPGPAGRVDAASLAGADGLPPGPAGRADAAASAGADGLPPGPAGQADAAASAGADGLPPGPAGRADAAATARADGLPPGPAGRADAAASGETVNLSATELLVKPFYLFRTYDPYEVQYRRKMLGDGVRFGKVGNHALDPPERHKLMGPVTRIGRSAHESDIVLKNITVGKRHAQIKREGQRHYLIDMKSLNGTYLNGGPIEPGVWEEIRSGDRLTFADWEYAFTDEPDMLRYP